MQENDVVKSTLLSKNITVLGRRTSVRLEPEMWHALQEIAERESCKIHDICSLIALRKKPRSSLTAAIRVFLMLYYRAAATEEGHSRAGHGNFTKMLARARLNGGHDKDDRQNANVTVSPDVAVISSVNAEARSKAKRSGKAAMGAS